MMLVSSISSVNSLETSLPCLDGQLPRCLSHRGVLIGHLPDPGAPCSASLRACLPTSSRLLQSDADGPACYLACELGRVVVEQECSPSCMPKKGLRILRVHFRRFIRCRLYNKRPLHTSVNSHDHHFQCLSYWTLPFGV